MAAHLVLMEKEFDLGKGDAAVNASRCRERLGRKRGKSLMEFCKFSVLFYESLRRAITQLAIDGGERRIERRSAEVSGDDRKATHEVHHVLVLESAERPVRIGLRLRLRADGAEAGSCKEEKT
jgi:hypothetical protein